MMTLTEELLENRESDKIVLSGLCEKAQVSFEYSEERVYSEIWLDCLK